MNNAEIQKKLDQLVEICNELDAEAKTRYGKNGNLFYEAGGAFHLMSDDCIGHSSERQKFVRVSSNGYCLLGGGAW